MRINKNYLVDKAKYAFLFSLSLFGKTKIRILLLGGIILSVLQSTLAMPLSPLISDKVNPNCACIQTSITLWKKGSGDPKFLDISEFIINWQKIKKMCFSVFLGDLEGVGTLCPPHSSYFRKG